MLSALTLLQASLQLGSRLQLPDGLRDATQRRESVVAGMEFRTDGESPHDDGVIARVLDALRDALKSRDLPEDSEPGCACMIEPSSPQPTRNPPTPMLPICPLAYLLISDPCLRAGLLLVSAPRTR